MVDADFKEPDEGGLSPKKGGLKTIIIIVVIAAVMGVGGFFAGKILSGGGEPKNEPTQTTEVKAGGDQNGTKVNGDSKGEKNSKEEASNKNEEANGEMNSEKGKSGFLSLDTFTVNLNDPFGRRYIECNLNLVLDDRSLVPKIKENELVMAKIRHEIFMTISAKSYSDLKSTAGKITLFEEVQMRINEILKEEMGVEPVTEVLQTKFLMQ